LTQTLSSLLEVRLGDATREARAAIAVSVGYKRKTRHERGLAERAWDPFLALLRATVYDADTAGRAARGDGTAPSALFIALQHSVAVILRRANRERSDNLFRLAAIVDLGGNVATNDEVATALEDLVVERFDSYRKSARATRVARPARAVRCSASRRPSRAVAPRRAAPRRATCARRLRRRASVLVVRGFPDLPLSVHTPCSTHRVLPAAPALRRLETHERSWHRGAEALQNGAGDE
jgi:hypothetical protein